MSVSPALGFQTMPAWGSRGSQQTVALDPDQMRIPLESFPVHFFQGQDDGRPIHEVFWWLEVSTMATGW